MFSLSQAAKRAGVSKATVHRAIKSGKLSASRQDDGSFHIDPAELARVYPDSLKPVETSQGSSVETTRNGGNTQRNAVLEAELTGARALLQFLETQAEDLRRDRDGWRQQAETAQRLLTHAREATIASAALPPRPWWKRLAG